MWMVVNPRLDIVIVKITYELWRSITAKNKPGLWNIPIYLVS